MVADRLVVEPQRHVSDRPDRPWGFNVAANLFGRQGTPLPYWDSRTGPVDGIGRNISVVADTDDFRTDDIITTDFRLEKEFAATSGIGFTFSIDGFNIFNENYVLQRERRLNGSRANYLDETLSPTDLETRCPTELEVVTSLHRPMQRCQGREIFSRPFFLCGLSPTRARLTVECRSREPHMTPNPPSRQTFGTWKGRSMRAVRSSECPIVHCRSGLAGRRDSTEPALASGLIHPCRAVLERRGADGLRSRQHQRHLSSTTFPLRSRHRSATATSFSSPRSPSGFVWPRPRPSTTCSAPQPPSMPSSPCRWPRTWAG